MSFVQKLRSLRIVPDDRGLTTVEYVILLAMICAVAVGTWRVFGKNVATYLAKSSDAINTNVSSDYGGSATPAPTAAAASGH